jgi:hypothetical protein
VQSAPFRVTVPKGTGSYPIILFGHGAGGSVRDNNFDRPLAEIGLGKANYEFDGWTSDTIVDSLGEIQRAFRGTSMSTSRLTQALANGAALDTLLATTLGDALAANELLGKVNPAAGRRPDTSVTVWGGGSMGGSMGGVVAQANPNMTCALLNVPGGAWTHFLPKSSFYSFGKVLIKSAYSGDFDARLAIAMTQTIWDDVDGAVWAGFEQRAKPVVLVQESMEDPIVTNEGTEMLSISLDARIVGVPLRTVGKLQTAPDLASGVALTQFRVPATGEYDVHGFADCRNPAGEAARAQMMQFLNSCYRGAPKVLPPALCLEGCDYTGRWKTECERVGGD